MFSKILIANRGEVALRVIRACRELGVKSVAVYSEADRPSRHVCMADESVCIGPGPSKLSYLDHEAVLSAAKNTGADAIHPGYGFLSENADFAQQVMDAGLTWVGPPPAAIRAMGSKTESRARMKAAGVPVVPGTTKALGSVDEAVEVARGSDSIRLFVETRHLSQVSNGVNRGLARAQGIDVQLPEHEDRPRSETDMYPPPASTRPTTGAWPSTWTSAPAVRPASWPARPRTTSR